MDNPEDIKRKRISLAISIGIHAILIVLFLFILAWKEPYPPIPEYGIELNFGMDETGSGDIQPIQETTNEVIEQTDSETITEEEVMDETQVEESETIPESEEPAQEDNTEVEEVIEDSQMEDSPDVIEPPEEQTADDIDEEVKEEAREEIQPEKPVEQTTADSQSNQEETRNELSTQGDNIEQEGDKGSETGELDARALYGTPGGGGGASLDLAGWIWDYAPEPQDTSDEYGRIVFEIKVDDQGEVIGVRTLEKTVSPQVEKIYREEVESLTFSPTSSNTIPAPISTGKITFIIKVK
jgi:protein TonB